MTNADLVNVGKHLAISTKSHVEKKIHEAIAPLLERIAQLESRPELKYFGAWDSRSAYSAGSLVTRSGGLWLAEQTTIAQPGAPDSGWRLVVKKGEAAR
jgi:hypothetical protein